MILKYSSKWIIQKKVEEEDEKYKNFRINGENYNFPHIYLTDEEINDFNEECKRCGIDLKVVPLSDYMNFNLAENEEVDIESNMKIINNLCISDSSNYINKPEENLDYKISHIKIDWNSLLIRMKQYEFESDKDIECCNDIISNNNKTGKNNKKKIKKIEEKIVILEFKYGIQQDKKLFVL